MSSFFFNIKSCTVIKCFDINKPYHEFLQGSDKELYDTCSTRGQRKRTFNEVSSLHQGVTCKLGKGSSKEKESKWET